MLSVRILTGQRIALGVLLALGLLAKGAEVRACTLAPIKLEELASSAAVIAIVEIGKLRWLCNEQVAEAKVTNVIKGDAPARLLLRVNMLSSCDFSEARAGERLLLFLDPEPHGGDCEMPPHFRFSNAGSAHFALLSASDGDPDVVFYSNNLLLPDAVPTKAAPLPADPRYRALIDSTPNGKALYEKLARTAKLSDMLRLLAKAQSSLEKTQRRSPARKQ